MEIVPSSTASRWITRRDSAAKTPGPESVACTWGAASARTARTRAMAAAWPTLSNPAARVCATRNARVPSALNHTPWRRPGAAGGSRRRSVATKLARRIARDRAAREHPGGRREQGEVFLQRRPQGRRREALGAHRRAQRVAMAHQHLALRGELPGCAIGDVVEGRIAGKARGQRAARARERLLVPALQRDQHEARDQSLAQLRHQQPLLRRGRLRQERGELGLDPQRPRGQEPECGAQEQHESVAKDGAARHHGGFVVSTERSPPVSRTSIFATCPSRPETTMRST